MQQPLDNKLQLISRQIIQGVWLQKLHTEHPKAAVDTSLEPRLFPFHECMICSELQWPCSCVENEQANLNTIQKEIKFKMQ
jgi:hypothetical protein